MYLLRTVTLSVDVVNSGEILRLAGGIKMPKLDARGNGVLGP